MSFSHSLPCDAHAHSEVKQLVGSISLSLAQKIVTMYKRHILILLNTLLVVFKTHFDFLT